MQVGRPGADCGIQAAAKLPFSREGCPGARQGTQRHPTTLLAGKPRFIALQSGEAPCGM